MGPIYFDLDALPLAGTIVSFHRRNPDTLEDEALQHFTLTRAKLHTTRTEEESAILTWVSHCTDCSAHYIFTAGLSTKAFYRRCKPCRTKWRKANPVRSWPVGPRIRHLISYEQKPYEDEIDPASLF